MTIDGKETVQTQSKGNTKTIEGIRRFYIGGLPLNVIANASSNLQASDEYCHHVQHQHHRHKSSSTPFTNPILKSIAQRFSVTKLGGND